mmetsp:Transcript_34565/g.108548  ORF Transcript_34565/g.108548 Transcript_34565/m.108548 type:complete len:320 (+) Transcript_34565:1000-1959(+)
MCCASYGPSRLSSHTLYSCRCSSVARGDVKARDRGGPTPVPAWSPPVPPPPLCYPHLALLLLAAGAPRSSAQRDAHSAPVRPGRWVATRPNAWSLRLGPTLCRGGTSRRSRASPPAGPSHGNGDSTARTYCSESDSKPSSSSASPDTVEEAPSHSRRSLAVGRPNVGSSPPGGGGRSRSFRHAGSLRLVPRRPPSNVFRSTRISPPAAMSSEAMSHIRSGRSSAPGSIAGHRSIRAFGCAETPTYAAGKRAEPRKGQFSHKPSMKVGSLAPAAGMTSALSVLRKKDCTGSRGPPYSAISCPGRSGARAKRPSSSKAGAT